MKETVQVADRIFDILECLSNSKSSSLSEITRATGISKSTVHRLIASMCARQYVQKNADNTYSIGYKLIEIVSLHINSLELLTEAKPFLSNVMRTLNLTVHLGILDGCNVVYLEKMDTYPNTRFYTQVGYHSPAYCSSIGKCLLACLSGDELDEVLYHCTFEKFTRNTITDIQELKRHLRVIRHQGWAMDNEEYESGHRCVAAPVFDYRGSPAAAISVSGSRAQLTDKKLEQAISEVKQAAAMLSRQLGYIE